MSGWCQQIRSCHIVSCRVVCPCIGRCCTAVAKAAGRTLSVETKSAVSSRVNWLIWSTMVAILGLAGAAASLDCHLRCILCCAPPTAGRAYEAGRALQTQRLRTRDAGADIVVCGCEGRRSMDGGEASLAGRCQPSRLGFRRAERRRRSIGCSAEHVWVRAKKDVRELRHCSHEPPLQHLSHVFQRRNYGKAPQYRNTTPDLKS